MLTQLRSTRLLSAASLVLAVCSAGCASMSHADRGALVGTTIGALGGGIIGHQAGNAGLGAVIGAGAGMVTGALVGDAEDAREERDAAIHRASYAEMRAALPPLTNADLMYMAQNGLGDEVILNSVRTRGGRFDLAPEALVQLKRNGVSDAVLAEIQRTGSTAPMYAPGPVYVRQPQPVIIVEPVYVPPPPPVGVHFSVGHSYHWNRGRPCR